MVQAIRKFRAELETLKLNRDSTSNRPDISLPSLFFRGWNMHFIYKDLQTTRATLTSSYLGR